jgi:hypothetical protein
MHKSKADKTLALALLIFGAGFSSVCLADNTGERCTKTTTSCLDTVNKQVRNCVTTTCTYADGHTTTSTTVEMVGGAKTGGGGTQTGAKPGSGAMAPTKMAPAQGR